VQACPAVRRHGGFAVSIYDCRAVRLPANPDNVPAFAFPIRQADALAVSQSATDGTWTWAGHAGKGMQRSLLMRLTLVLLSRFLLAVCAIIIPVTAWLLAPAGTFILSCLFGWVLLSLAAIDLRSLLLPDPLTLAAALLGALMVATSRPDAWLEHVIGGLAGYLVLFAVETVYLRLRGRDGLGRGDAKLLGAIGLWVGWTRLPDVLLIASLSGLLAALLYNRLLRHELSASTPVAFGPWLALAGWISWLSGPLFVPAV